MACGCGEFKKQSANGNGNGMNGSPGLSAQVEAILEGRQKLGIVEAVQLIAGVATIILFFVYLIRS